MFKQKSDNLKVVLHNFIIQFHATKKPKHFERKLKVSKITMINL